MVKQSRWRVAYTIKMSGQNRRLVYMIKVDHQTDSQQGVSLTISAHSH